MLLLNISGEKSKDEYTLSSTTVKNSQLLQLIKKSRNKSKRILTIISPSDNITCSNMQDQVSLGMSPNFHPVSLFYFFFFLFFSYFYTQRLPILRRCIENLDIWHGFTQVCTLQYEKTFHFNVKSMATLSIALVSMLATHTILNDYKLQLLRLQLQELQE